MDEVKDIVKSVLGVFTTEYVKAYAVALVNLKIREKEEEAEDELTSTKMKLKERPENEEDIMTGTLTKEGAVRKSWKKRFFIVKSDYTIEYYVDEAAHEKGKKPKGIISPCGYRVHSELGNVFLERAEELAKKMDVDVSQLPKAKEYPEHTFELYHNRRRSYYIQCADEEEKKMWAEMMDTCCRRAYGFKDKEEVHKIAYGRAIRATRWSLGRWGWWSWGGSEIQVLSDLIVQELEYETVGKILSKVPVTAPYAIRWKARNTAMKQIDTIVSSMVGPAWIAMKETVDKARPTVEQKLENLDPISNAKKSTREKIREACNSVIGPVVEEHVSPHVKKYCGFFTEPIAEAYELLEMKWEEDINDFFKKFDPSSPEKNLEGLAKKGSYSGSTYKARQSLRQLYEPLNLISKAISFSVWSIMNDGNERIRQLYDNALYTFEYKVRKKAAKGNFSEKELEEIKNKVAKHLAHDIKKSKRTFQGASVLSIFMAPLNRHVLPSVRDLLNPIQNLMPDPMQQLINVNSELNTVLQSIIMDQIGTALG